MPSSHAVPLGRVIVRPQPSMVRSGGGVTLSFCTTCCNRTDSLKRVFDENRRLIDDATDVEWVIVNFSSTDDLDDFMEAKLPSSSNRIIYARDLVAKQWHMSVAKNLAHRLGRGRVIVNLDCDNVIGSAIETVRRAFQLGVQVLHMWSGRYGDGTCGRIAIAAHEFVSLGGYDEAFYPMGYDDLDLLRRARARGLRIASGNEGLSIDCAIQNTRAESVANCGSAIGTWAEWNRANRRQSAQNIAAGRVIANLGAGWTPTVVDVHCGSSINA